MHALVIYETMFGNTNQIAEAIAAGLSSWTDVTITNVTSAPAEVPPYVDLLVVGGPTPAFSMSRASTRRAAHHAAGHTDTSKGIREWLRELPEGAHPQTFAAFDTRVDRLLLRGAASRSATRLARHRGFKVSRPGSFRVEGNEGPLVGQEIDRAREWGRQLSTEFVQS